jgi:hypothetical protein
MAITAFSGPLMVWGQVPQSGLEYNPDFGASLFNGGAGIMDPRLLYTYQPGEAQYEPDFGWLGFDNVTTLSAVPYTAATSAVVASANPTSAALALVSANSSTTGVYITPNITRADTGALDTGVAGAGLVALDAYCSMGTCTMTNGVLTVGTNTTLPLSPGMVLLTASGTVTGGTVAGTVILQQLTAGTGGQGVAGTYLTSNSLLNFTSSTVTAAAPTPFQCAVPSANGTPSVFLWNPNSMIGRTLQVTAASGASYATATIAGYDVYGFPMTEALTISAGSTVAGKKAWKYIRSVTLSGGTADTTHAYSVDTLSVFGLPLRSDNYADITVNYASSVTAITGITAATSYLPSDRTTATATTGDVRGTIGAFTASTGASKLVVRQSPGPYNIGFTAGLFGVAQYANF